MVKPPTHLREFDSLLEVVKGLRGPGGCPWDIEQTHRSLTPYAIEEAHELAEAIEAGHKENLISELGDLLLQVVLHSEIGRQSGQFDIHDVIENINEKMIRRHPHVFADGDAKTSREVLDQWSQLKEKEKKTKPAPTDRFDVPLSLPALSRANKIGQKTRKSNFDWDDHLGVNTKLQEELKELQEAIASDDRASIEQELGDVLFTVAQLARHLEHEPEQCLRTANTRFEKRFFQMIRNLEKQQLDMNSLDSATLEKAWQIAKKQVL